MSFVTSQWLYKPDKKPRDIPSVQIDRVEFFDGIRYAVRQAGACMDADGEWEFEPQPSSRTDEWLARFRFTSWQEAAEAIDRHCTPLGRFQKTYGHLV